MFLFLNGLSSFNIKNHLDSDTFIFRDPDPGFREPDPYPGFSNRNPCFRDQDPGFREPDPGFRDPDSGFTDPDLYQNEMVSKHCLKGM